MLSALAVPEQVHNEDCASLLGPGHPHTLQLFFSFWIVMTVTDDNRRRFMGGLDRAVVVGCHWQIHVTLKDHIVNAVSVLLQSASDHRVRCF